MSLLDNMKHREKRRAPSVLGRFSCIIGLVYLINWALGDWTRTDLDVATGMALAAVLVYFNPPTVIKYDIFTTPINWKERIRRFF